MPPVSISSFNPLVPYIKLGPGPGPPDLPADPPAYGPLPGAAIRLCPLRMCNMAGMPADAGGPCKCQSRIGCHLMLRHVSALLMQGTSSRLPFQPAWPCQAQSCLSRSSLSCPPLSLGVLRPWGRLRRRRLRPLHRRRRRPRRHPRRRTAGAGEQGRGKQPCSHGACCCPEEGAPHASAHVHMHVLQQEAACAGLCLTATKAHICDAAAPERRFTDSAPARS